MGEREDGERERRERERDAGCSSQPRHIEERHRGQSSECTGKTGKQRMEVEVQVEGASHSCSSDNS